MYWKLQMKDVINPQPSSLHHHDIYSAREQVMGFDNIDPPDVISQVEKIQNQPYFLSGQKCMVRKHQRVHILTNNTVDSWFKYNSREN